MQQTPQRPGKEGSTRRRDQKMSDIALEHVVETHKAGRTNSERSWKSCLRGTGRALLKLIKLLDMLPQVQASFCERGLSS